MFIYYHYTTCFYPLNPVLGISSHLGRVTIVRDSTITGQQSHSFRIIKDFLSGQSFRQRFCQIIITLYVMFSNNTVHTTIISYRCNIGSVFLSIVVEFFITMYVMFFYSIVLTTVVLYRCYNGSILFAIAAQLSQSITPLVSIFPVQGSQLADFFSSLLLHQLWLVLLSQSLQETESIQSVSWVSKRQLLQRC